MTEHTHPDTFDLPNHTPEEFQTYQDIITGAVDWTHEHKGSPNYVTDELAADIIIISFLISDFEWWSTKFLKIQRPARIMYRDPDTFWRTIAMAVSTPEVEQQCLIVHPDLDREKYFNHAFNIPAPDKITPSIVTKLKTTTTPYREKTLIEFVTNRAPSLNYVRAFIFISRHTKNRFSSRGREVYPYGQKYVAQQLKISRRTTDKVFSWLRRHHIIFKRSNENPELKKSATWFVCTSRKQSIYFLDPQGRRQKKGSSRSSRKRHRRAVHT